MGFSCGPPLWWSLCVREDILWRRSCVFLSCSAQGRLLLSLFLVLLLCLFLQYLQFSAVFPAAGAPYGVPQPFWLQLPVLLLRWSFIVGFDVFGATLGFLPYAVLFLRACGFPAQVTLGGFSAFYVTVCVTYCYAGGVGWAATLSWC